MVDTFNDLVVLSGKLNEKSNQLNQIITTINRKLGGLNLGIETWLTSQPLEEGEHNGRDRHGNPDRYGNSSASVVLLGYCRVDDQWQLAVKDATFNKGIDSETAEQWIEVSQSETPTPLLKASREIRIKSMGRLHSLLVDIQMKASMLLAGIEAAEEAAAKL